VIEYLCEEASVMQFSLIYKIVRGGSMWVLQTELGRICFDPYGLNTSAILVDIAERQLEEDTELMKQLNWLDTAATLTYLVQSRSQTTV
jgi:hypothetical protein